jgi:hypothetical protein
VGNSGGVTCGRCYLDCLVAFIVEQVDLVAMGDIWRGNEVPFNIDEAYFTAGFRKEPVD